MKCSVKVPKKLNLEETATYDLSVASDIVDLQPLHIMMPRSVRIAGNGKWQRKKKFNLFSRIKHGIM